MIPTRIYRLIPTARPDDPNWGRASCQGEVIVRARSSGEARAVAARAQAEAAGGSEDTTTQVTASAFYDSNLYGVRGDASDAFPPDGPVAVVGGTFQMPANYKIGHRD